MAHHRVEVAVQGPWSLATSRAFWEGFTPSELPQREGEALRATFLVEGEWRRASVSVTQRGATAVLELAGDGDLELAAAQVCRFLSLDVDGRAWPPGRKAEYLRAVAEAALDGVLDAVTLRAMKPAGRCSPCGRSRDWARSRPSWSCCAG
jgi:DNA-3-methyladenine glycosylase II